MTASIEARHHTTPLRVLYVDPAAPDVAVWQDFPFLDHAQPLDNVGLSRLVAKQSIRSGTYFLTGARSIDDRWIYMHRATTA